jgi:hypothetical protein
MSSGILKYLFTLSIDNICEKIGGTYTVSVVSTSSTPRFVQQGSLSDVSERPFTGISEIEQYLIDADTFKWTAFALVSAQQLFQCLLPQLILPFFDFQVVSFSAVAALPGMSLSETRRAVTR